MTTLREGIQHVTRCLLYVVAHTALNTSEGRRLRLMCSFQMLRGRFLAQPLLYNAEALEGQWL